MSYYKVQYKTSVENSPPSVRSAHTDFTSFADITKIQLSWEDANGLDITGWLFSFEVDGFIQLSSVDNDAEFSVYKIIILNNNTDSPTNPYIELEVVPTQINGVEYISGTDNLIISHWNTAGADGTSGTSGTSGVAGEQGIAGPAGIAGEQGPAGIPGEQGIAGPAGIAGPDGATGPTGADGANGEQGPAGPAGVTGSTGEQGFTGEDGSTGEQGPAGPTGVTGFTGEQGFTGEDGATGEQGPSGPAGPAGANGANGPAGEQGEAGVDALVGINLVTIVSNLEQIVEELKKAIPPIVSISSSSAGSSSSVPPPPHDGHHDGHHHNGHTSSYFNNYSYSDHHGHHHGNHIHPFLLRKFTDAEVDSIYVKYSSVLEGLSNEAKGDKLVDLVSDGSMSSDVALILSIKEGLTT